MTIEKNNFSLKPRSASGILSIVIPICNEEASIHELYKRLMASIRKIGIEWEIIFIEDSSNDNSPCYLKELAEKDMRIRVIFLTRSFGHHTAITAGLEYSIGDHIIIMDGDLQHRPEDIPRLFKKYLKGYDIVYCQRLTKQSWVKQKGSDFLNYFANKLSDSKININSSIFRIISKRVKCDIIKMREVGRFITGMMSWLGYPAATIEIEEDKRKGGETKYSLLRLLNLFSFGIISFSTKPLIVSTYIGFAISITTFVWGLIFMINSLINGTEIEGYPSLILSIFFLGGLILFVLGIIGHYLSIAFIQLQDRPMYIIKDTLNIQDNSISE